MGQKFEHWFLHGYVWAFVVILIVVAVKVIMGKPELDRLYDDLNDCNDAVAAFALMDIAALKGYDGLARDAAWKGFQLQRPRLLEMFRSGNIEETRALLQDPEFLGIKPAEGRGRVEDIIREQLRILEELDGVD